MTWKIYLEEKPWEGVSALYIAKLNQDGSRDIVEPFVFKRFPQNKMVLDVLPAITDTHFGVDDVRGFLQAMSDAAWELGIKPKQIEDHTNELKATRYHLEDMRSLALKPQE